MSFLTLGSISILFTAMEVILPIRMYEIFSQIVVLYLLIGTLLIFTIIASIFMSVIWIIQDVNIMTYNSTHIDLINLGKEMKSKLPNSIILISIFLILISTLHLMLGSSIYDIYGYLIKFNVFLILLLIFFSSIFVSSLITIEYHNMHHQNTVKVFYCNCTRFLLSKYLNL